MSWQYPGNNSTNNELGCVVENFFYFESAVYGHKEETLEIRGPANWESALF